MAKIKLTATLIEPAGKTLPVMLVQFSERIKNWREFWATVFIPRYLSQVQQNFQTEGELSGQGGWPDLSPEYAAWKNRHFPGTLILERTRRMRESLAPGATGPDTVIEAGPLQLKIGTAVPYAKHHVKTRPFLVKVVVDEWAPFIGTWVRQQAGEVGLMAFRGASVGRDPLTGRFVSLRPR